MSYLKLWTLISIGATLTIVGDVYLKRSNGFGRPADAGLGLGFYALGCLPVVLAFKNAQFGAVFIVWEAITVVLAVVIGRALFGETLTAGRIVAVILAIAALILSNR